MLVRKKTPRIYTPAKDVRDLTHIFKSHGAKVAFRYYRGKQLLSMSYREFSDLITELAGVLKLCREDTEAGIKNAKSCNHHTDKHEGIYTVESVFL